MPSSEPLYQIGMLSYCPRCPPTVAGIAEDARVKESSLVNAPIAEPKVIEFVDGNSVALTTTISTKWTPPSTQLYIYPHAVRAEQVDALIRELSALSELMDCPIFVLETRVDLPTNTQGAVAKKKPKRTSRAPRK